MEREVMKQTIEVIIVQAKSGVISVEDASEAVVKAFERSLEESIAAAAKMVPGLDKILKMPSSGV